MAKVQIDEGSLTKGQLRKLTAVRKSFGQEIADKAFAQWLSDEPKEQSEPEDKNALAIAATLEADVLSGKIKIPRGGYLVRRGRGRVIVERGEGSGNG